VHFPASASRSRSGKDSLEVRRLLPRRRFAEQNAAAQRHPSHRPATGEFVKPISSFVLAAVLSCATAGPLAAADAGIEQSFDRNKGAIYALYGRALRETPGLKGKIVFEIGIATSGEVSSCRIKYSELNHPDLEAKLVERIKLFRFPPRQSPTTVVKPVDFFPAT
jgi:hypothetical protein